MLQRKMLRRQLELQTRLEMPVPFGTRDWIEQLSRLSRMASKFAILWNYRIGYRQERSINSHQTDRKIQRSDRAYEFIARKYSENQHYYWLPRTRTAS